MNDGSLDVLVDRFNKKVLLRIKLGDEPLFTVTLDKSHVLELIEGLVSTLDELEEAEK